MGKLTIFFFNIVFSWQSQHTNWAALAVLYSSHYAYVCAFFPVQLEFSIGYSSLQNTTISNYNNCLSENLLYIHKLYYLSHLRYICLNIFLYLSKVHKYKYTRTVQVIQFVKFTLGSPSKTFFELNIWLLAIIIT